MSKILIIGGGAAGMMAAITAKANGNEVHIFERNEKLGKKIYITGKGRCNVTNNVVPEDFFENIITNKKFLYSSIYTFSPQQTMDFFEKIGLNLKTERGNRVFPNSDKSSDVIKALENHLKKIGVNIHLNIKVNKIHVESGKFAGVYLENDVYEKGDSLIIATGGFSYQATGSTGDGYKFAKQAGHKIIETQPALVPLNTNDKEIYELQGLSLKNVKADLYSGDNLLYSDFGEMLFTHFGISGPLVLSASSFLKKENKNLKFSIDLKPALNSDQLDKRILRDFQENINKSFKNSIDKLLPKKIIPIIIKRSGINPEKKVNEITKQERNRLVETIKKFEIKITGKRDFNEAIITKGGVDVKQVNPKTLESKLIKGVYFAGEVLDIDALTGGFNLQLAWSTGYLAGLSVN